LSDARRPSAETRALIKGRICRVDQSSTAWHRLGGNPSSVPWRDSSPWNGPRPHHRSFHAPEALAAVLGRSRVARRVEREEARARSR
jgi:hypothetical protein